jgi:DNA-directed RNA polymerase specialized sigma24 family protein
MINPEPWVSRRHRGPRATPLPLAEEHRERVEAAIRPATAEKRIVLRGMALLAMADGLSILDTAEALHVNERTVRRWRRRFQQADDPVAVLADAPRSGRPISLFRTLPRQR